MKNIKYSCIGSEMFMKSSRHKDEDKTSTGKQKESV